MKREREQVTSRSAPICGCFLRNALEDATGRYADDVIP
jgi:hypothetical protein